MVRIVKRRGEVLIMYLLYANLARNAIKFLEKILTFCYIYFCLTIFHVI